MVENKNLSLREKIKNYREKNKDFLFQNKKLKTLEKQQKKRKSHDHRRRVDYYVSNSPRDVDNMVFPENDALIISFIFLACALFLISKCKLSKIYFLPFFIIQFVLLYRSKKYHAIMKNFILFSLIHLFCFFIFWFTYGRAYYSFWRALVFFSVISLFFNFCICLFAVSLGVVLLPFACVFSFFLYPRQDWTMENLFHKIFYSVWKICFWIITYHYVYWFVGKFSKVLFRGDRGSFGGGGSSGKY